VEEEELELEEVEQASEVEQLSEVEQMSEVEAEAAEASESEVWGPPEAALPALEARGVQAKPLERRTAWRALRVRTPEDHLE